MRSSVATPCPASVSNGHQSRAGLGRVHVQVPVDVATYLLNEKRSEIFMVETRLKVNVLLIPNPNLETPNYLIERLRHDAPQLDCGDRRDQRGHRR